MGHREFSYAIQGEVLILTPAQGEVLVARYFERRPVEDIAATRNVSVRAVQHLLARAVKNAQRQGVTINPNPPTTPLVKRLHSLFGRSYDRKNHTWTPEPARIASPTADPCHTSTM